MIDIKWNVSFPAIGGKESFVDRDSLHVIRNVGNLSLCVKGKPTHRLVDGEQI